LALAGFAAGAETFPFDHIHLGVPDPAEAAKWYEKNFDARRHPEGPDRLMFGSARFVFVKMANGKPSLGSSIDHIAFSYSNVNAKIKELEAAGVKVVMQPHKMGLFQTAFVEDPWGTRIEVVEDKERLGLHHVHLKVANPDAVFSWMLAKFGGEKAKYRGKLEGVKYSVRGFDDLWIFAERGDTQPSEGHAIDHIGWRSPGPLAQTINTLRGQGVTVTQEPRQAKLPNGPAINFAYIAGPAGIKIEIVERPDLKPGE
jgi:catechol 2,3-dioxygenase-like lactoylglutathione lyase family enzyme